MSGSHSHHAPDVSLLANDKGIRALKISFVGLMITAIFQGVVVYFSSSAALLGDTLHNLADAFTAIPLWIAFAFSRRKPNNRFTYGYSRLEDVAGLFIIALIFLTAAVVGYESFQKFKTGVAPTHLNWVIAGSIIGFLGNEWVARLRMRVGHEINSAALIADGQHARADGYTSLGVFAGAIGVYLGFPLADASVGMVLAILILKIGWDSSKELLSHIVDAISPELVEGIRTEAQQAKNVLGVNDVRARYVGHHLRVELTIEVDGKISVLEGHDIAVQVQHGLQKKFPFLVSPAIHVDPKGHEGEAHHFAKHHTTRA